MLIKELDKYITNKRGVIHLGACEAEERDWYYTKGFEPIYYIEANPEKSFIIQDNIREYENQYIITAAISDTENVSDFYITNYGGVSSSLLFPNLRPEIYDNQSHTIEKIIQVKTQTLESVINNFNIPIKDIKFLVMDIEGSELKALKSLKGLITNFDYILAEYHTFENYIGCSKVEDLIFFLKQFGFKEVIRVDSGEEWGDILFEKIL
jgi:FkbM family methyltransferase